MRCCLKRSENEVLVWKISGCGPLPSTKLLVQPSGQNLARTIQKVDAVLIPTKAVPAPTGVVANYSHNGVPLLAGVWVSLSFFRRYVALGS